MKTFARFDARLTPEQKAYFEYAASLGGFRTLTEFVVSAAQQKAEQIVERHERILATEKDRNVFFEAIMNPPEPTDKLIQALQLASTFDLNDVIKNTEQKP